MRYSQMTDLFLQRFRNFGGLFYYLWVSVFLLGAGLCLQESPLEAASRLKVSADGHFLILEDGRPFFYLGDTAWELFHRLNREEVDRYLKNRASRGFTVVQAAALAELNGLNDPNPYGFRPLTDNDPTRPDVKDGPENDYWDHVDFIVKKADSYGIYIGFLPTWGDKWNKKWGEGPGIFTPENAAVYGEWLGRRYRGAANIIWILGGDRPVENDRHREILRAMAKGLRRGDGGTHLITLHPTGGQGSAEYFPDEAWLDFHMRQNGHEDGFNPRYQATRADYNRVPAKPVLDGEPIYEDHPIAFDAGKNGHSVAADVRRPLYWDLFSGACGHTYGNHAVWQMWMPGKNPINNPLMTWDVAINQPGAGQMQYARWLLESRPMLTRIPDDSLIVAATPVTAVPGAGLKRLVATRDSAGGYAMVYVPAGRPFKVSLNFLQGNKVKAWWFNPRNGEASLIGEFPKQGEQEFLCPTPGENLDWVLVLDDAARNFPPPGSRKTLSKH